MTPGDQALEGLIWHSTPRATVGLVVSGGVVVDTPPYARKWAMGRPAAELLADPRADTAWIPMTPDEADQAAVALFQRNFPDARVIKEYPTMTTAPEQAPQHDQAEDPIWGQNQTHPVYPEQPQSKLANHAFTVSLDGRGPHVAIRAQSATEYVERIQEFINAGGPEAVVALRDKVNALLNVAPEPPQQAPQGPMAPFQAQAQQQFNQQPAQQFPQQGGQAPAAWQNVGAPQQQGGFNGGGQQGPKPRPPWPQVYKITVPFPQKDAFKAFREANKQALAGKIQWIAKGDYYVHGDVVQQFGHLNPVPA